jgi:predicted metal-dependent phosphoesterase TrpH
MSSLRQWRAPLLAVGFILFAHAHSVPAIRDAVTKSSVPLFHLQFPVWHLIFTPLCSVADFLTVLSLHELEAFLVWTFVLILLLSRRRVLGIMLFLLFVAWAALIPRPMARLVCADPDVLLVDFHSHTQYSHDGRHSFTPEANMRWHARQGFEAGFITDHNRTEASKIAHDESKAEWRATGYESLEGEEVSLLKTHLVLLGNRERIDNSPYDSDTSRISTFVRDMHRQGFLVVASLPEYWFYHWGKGVQDFVDWGMDGFEIINSAPKALDFPRPLQLEVIDLCRKNNLFMTGISDNHGYGYATDAWNAVRLPGWPQMDPESLEMQLLSFIKKTGFSAVQVIERTTIAPTRRLDLFWNSIANFVQYWRQLSLSQVISWVCWLGLWAFWRSRDRP